MTEPAGATEKRIDLQILTGFLNTLESYSTDLVQHLRSGAKLCHYTSLQGALGIISSGDLFLTDSRFCNDHEELSYGHHLVKEVLLELSRATDDRVRRDWLDEVGRELAESVGDQVYICCFCEEGNLLGQWRGYAENGGGVSVEFHPEGFAAVAGPDCADGLMRLWKVFYKQDQQRKIVRECIDYSWGIEDYTDERKFRVSEALRFFMPTFKNADFKEEQERRLIFSPYPSTPVSPDFRIRSGLLIPHVTLVSAASARPTFKLPIKEVVVGPGPHKEMNAESLRQMLVKYEYEGVSVRQSSTPFRA